jgi:HEAT repeat protein
MNIREIFQNKELKAKQRTETISELLLSKNISTDEIIEIARTLKAPEKATCIEAIEFATQKNPELVTKKCFDFIVESLADKAPRVKWESARVVGNTAKIFQKNLDQAITNLLINSEDSGTVVRWSAAFALGEIYKVGTPHNKELSSTIEAIIEREEKNSIKKIYISALKKAKR